MLSVAHARCPAVVVDGAWRCGRADDAVMTSRCGFLGASRVPFAPELVGFPCIKELTQYGGLCALGK